MPEASTVTDIALPSPALPPTGDGWPSFRTQLRCIDLALMYPDASQAQLANMLQLSGCTVSRSLNTDFAKQRLIRAYDIAPIVHQSQKASVLDAQVVHRKTMGRVLRELDKKVPNSAVVHAGVKVATDVLQGSGVLKNQLEVQHKGATLVDYADIGRLLADPAVMRAIEAERGNTPPPGVDDGGEAQPPCDRTESVDLDE